MPVRSCWNDREVNYEARPTTSRRAGFAFNLSGSSPHHAFVWLADRVWILRTKVLGTSVAVDQFNAGVTAASSFSFVLIR
jgi:hypothetical protein